MRDVKLEKNGDEYKLTVVKDIERELSEIKKIRDAETNNGFSKDRNLRQIGHIPLDVLMSLGEEGVELMEDPEKAREFFKKHPEYSLV